MNVNELYQQMEKVQQAASELSTLSLQSLEISLQVNQQGQVCKGLKPSVDNGRTLVSYDNLWSDVSNSMFEQVLGEIDSMRRALTARLLHASARIERDIVEQKIGGTISFWRNGSSWLPPLVHDYSWEGGCRMIFADGFDAGSGDVNSFICKRHLWEMPEEYQSDFITGFWSDFSANAMEILQYSDGPPPTIDGDIAESGSSVFRMRREVWT